MANVLVDNPFNYSQNNYAFDRQISKPLKTDRQIYKPINIDIKKINKTINEFFIGLTKPVSLDEINILKTFAQSLYPYYFVDEQQNDYKYELSIKQNLADDYSVLPKYVLDLTTYCNKKMLLHVRFDNLEYTQYQIHEYVFQLYKTQNLTKIYNTKLNMYHSIEQEKHNYRTITRILRNADENDNNDEDDSWDWDSMSEENDENIEDKFVITDVIEKAVNDVFNENCYFNDNKKIYDKSTYDYSLHPINRIIRINSHDYPLLIKKLNNNMKYYNLSIKNFDYNVTYEIISDDLIQNILVKVLDLNFIDNNIVKNTIDLSANINLNDLYSIKSHYFKLSIKINNETFTRKQLYYNGMVIFDGIGNIIENSQMLINHSPFYGNRSPSVNEFKPYDSSCNKSTILLNKTKEYINELKLQLPDFLADNQTDLMKQYVMTTYSNFNVKKLHKEGNAYKLTTLKYNNDNLLISKITRLFGLRNLIKGHKTVHIEQEIYNTVDGTVISKLTETTKTVNGMINELMNHTYLIRRNYKIEYSKTVRFKEYQSYNKKIYKDNILIYDGTIVNNDMTVDLNQMDECDKNELSFNDILNYNFISSFNFDFNALYGNDNLGRLDIMKCFEKEILITDDDKYKFEFTYHFPDKLIHRYGNVGSAVKNIIATKSETKKENINSIDQHNYDDNGQQINSKFINESNRLTIKALSEKEMKEGRIGYKAARTHDNKMCIIKLFLPKDAKVAWDQHKDKYRTNKAIILSIKKVYYEKKHHYYIKDFNLDDCGICLDAPATHIAHPCRHKLCGSCWAELINASKNKNCPSCRGLIDKVEEVPIGKLPEKCDIDENEEILEAYSCVHTDQFVYRKNEQITIDNFDGNLKKVCAPGIHFHDNEKDVFQWFEYMNIPDDILSDTVPWNDDYSKSYSNMINKRRVFDKLNINSSDSDDSENYIVSKGRKDKPGKKNKNDKGNKDDDIEFAE
ncbi:zinc finger RING/FYVE/PHD-type protein [Fadolivirus algeromassiliense]|jgi:hypothetical protein|uniref:Zinc finger RING/FYVE/PHD-type protein n=1 Tax=Fadolivirus FV1/VV64 TaxID=3070911 RepID=A0A7D3R1C5_9VIRU|nr:zinc finger RING/FYVE/PHD-type protein [Fadolivirus algeromassiliense]QKF93718.1 zinc finger RING/FYVE/PHD-type protein [Fadolivirus FV1/VV64]